MRLSENQHIALTSILQNPLGQRVLNVIKANGGEARFVGGIIRDALIGADITNHPDIDMAMTLAPDTAMIALQKDGLKVLPTGIDHGTITVFDKKDHRQKIELTSLRSDADTDGRHASVIFTQDWEGDAARRDFTINAIYLDAEGNLFDPCHGVDDLQKGIVRFIGQAKHRIQEDHLRILRYFRFYARFGCAYADDDAITAITETASLLTRISGERLAMELARILPMGMTKGLETMAMTGVDRVLVPSGFNLAAMGALSRLSLPMSDMGKMPLAAGYAVLVDDQELDELAEQLRLSMKLRRQIDYLAKGFETDAIMGDHWQQAAWYEKPHPDAAASDLAWRFAIWQSKAGQAITQDHFERLAVWQVPDFPLKGQDLLAKGIASGPGLGQVLRQLETKWVASDFTLSRDDLLAEL